MQKKLPLAKKEGEATQKSSPRESNKKEITEKIISGREKAKRIENEERHRQYLRDQERRNAASSSSDNDDGEKNNDSNEEGGNESQNNKNKKIKKNSFTTGQVIGHAMLAVIFVSFPLSEPGIDWEGVFYLIAVNFLYNFVVRASSLNHLVLLSLVNIVTLQWYKKVPHLWLAVLSMGPVRLSATIGLNVFALILGYYLYIRNKKEGRRRNRAWDLFLSSLLVANVLVAIFLGTIGVSEVKSILRGFASLFVNLPNINNNANVNVQQQQQDPTSSGFQPPPPNGDEQTFKHKAENGMEFEFF